MSQLVRAFRGATTVDADDADQIRTQVCEMVTELLRRNALDNADLISAYITVTPDLTSMFAATAIREGCGLDDLPLMGAVEADVAGGPERCIRVMIHAHSNLARSDAQHVYFGGAAALRPDLSDS